MKRNDIITEARKWLDTPFVHQGRSDMGLDCVGLIIKVGEYFDVPYEDKIGYVRAPHDNTFLEHLRKFLKRAPIDAKRDGLIGVFRENLFPCHVGIFGRTDDGFQTLINTRVDRRMVVEEKYDDARPDDFKLVMLLSYPGLEDL